MSKTISRTNRESELGKGFDLLFILKSVAFAYALSVVLLFFTALIATYQSFSDKGIGILVNIVPATAAIVCGFLSGRNSSRGGLLSGAVSGIVYTLLLCVVGNILSQTFSFGSSAITAIIIGLVCGSVGGIVGINSKSNRRR